MAKNVLSDLQVLMGRMGEAYFFTEDITEKLTEEFDVEVEADFAMPISSDGVNFNPGSPDITEEKITAGQTWYTMAEKGDDDISMQVPSLAEPLLNLLYEKKMNEVKAKGYEGAGYSLAPKKVQGSWVFFDKEKTVMIILPKTDNYANFVGGTGDAMGYNNVAIKALSNKNGADIIVMQKKAA